MADSDKESGEQNTSNTSNDPPPKVYERFLPVANVNRIMKKALPANAKISKDAKEAVQECVSEFISFITGEASDKCHREKRKTINGDDILWTMSLFEFDEYVKPLSIYLQKFREMEGEKNSNSKQEKDASKNSNSKQEKDASGNVNLTNPGDNISGSSMYGDAIHPSMRMYGSQYYHQSDPSSSGGGGFEPHGRSTHR